MVSTVVTSRTRPQRRIGIVAPPWLPVPPAAYGGTEQVVALLAEGLADRGHEVVLVAAPGSRVPGVQVVAPLTSVPERIGLSEDEHRHVLLGVDALGDCEVVVDHSGPVGGLVASLAATPSLHVVHGPLAPENARLYKAIAARSPSLRLIAISHAQRRSAPGLPFAGVCHNGIDVSAIPFSRRAEGYLAFLGRICPDKGPVEAIEIARAAGRPLVMAAKCREPHEREYFERQVAPRLGPDVHWLGEVTRAEAIALLAGASALLFPISWPEPFGMVMIEAMAAGTPVLATRYGSVPEVVADGVTGFVRSTPRELVEAVGRLDEIDRAACRSRVAARFSAEAMTASYERIIAATTAGAPALLRRARAAVAG